MKLVSTRTDESQYTAGVRKVLSERTVMGSESWLPELAYNKAQQGRQSRYGLSNAGLTVNVCLFVCCVLRLEVHITVTLMNLNAERVVRSCCETETGRKTAWSPDFLLLEPRVLEGERVSK